MKFIQLFVFILFLCPTSSFGQSDSLTAKSDTSHSVRRATIYSAVLPGAGQVYNHFAQPKGKKKAYWKVPLIYAGLGLSGYSLIYNQSKVLAYRKEYRYREANPDSAIINLSEYSSSNLLVLEKQNANFRDYSILAFVFVYALQVADAAVEAHFVHFDISRDLSLSIRPWSYQNRYSGLSLSFNFR